MAGNKLLGNRQTQRNYGIDALRIVSMLMVVLVHILGHGGILDSLTVFSLKYEIVCFMDILACCAVNCYALISGYVGVCSKYRYSNVVILWLRVVFYSVGITVVFKLLNLKTPNIKGILMLFFPVLTDKYWYFTSYFLLFLFIPILNYALNNIDRKRLRMVLIPIIFCTSILAPIFGCLSGNIWGLGSGYTPFWLMILYLIGGYIRKYGFLTNLKKIWLLLSYFLVALLTLSSKWIIQVVTPIVFGSVKYEKLWISYISITIVAEAVLLLLVFERVSFPLQIKKVITLLAPLAFSVYLIQEHPYVREYLIDNKFNWIADLSTIFMFLTIVGVVLAIFLTCIAIDSLRELLFRFLKIKQRLNNLETTIRKKILSKEKD